MNGIFVAAIGAIFDAVALVRIGNASAALASELIFAARLIGAGVEFVGTVAAVVLAIAGERHPDAVIISALIFIRLTGERSAALVRVFVTRSFVAAV